MVVADLSISTYNTFTDVLEIQAGQLLSQCYNLTEFHAKKY
jgi:hypothetical protein